MLLSIKMTGKVAFETGLEAQVEFPKQKKEARRHNPFGEMFGGCLIKLIIHVANEPATCVCVWARARVCGRCVHIYAKWVPVSTQRHVYKYSE